MSAPRPLTTRARAWLALIVVAGVVLTMGLARWEIERQRQRAYADFLAQAERVRKDLMARMNVYAYLLEGATRLFAATPEISPAVFHAYVDGSNLQQHFPGIQGVGFARVIRRDELPAFEAAQRQAVIDDYHVWPPGEREVYAPVAMVEPMNERNPLALGFDMYTEPTRGAAMRAAANARAPRLTAGLMLLLDDSPVNRTGFVLYAPLFDQQAPEHLRGFVYVVSRVGEFIDNILREAGATCDVEVYDVDEAHREILLHATGPAPDEATSGTASKWISEDLITPFGRVWRVRVCVDAARGDLPDPWRLALLCCAGLALTGVVAATFRRHHRLASTQ